MHHPTEEGEGIATHDLLDVGIGVTSGYEASNDVFAVGRRLETIQVRRWMLVRRVTAQHLSVEVDVVTDKRVGPDRHMVNPS